MSRDRAAWLSGRARRLRPLAHTPQNSQNIAQKGNGLRALHAKEALNVSKNRHSLAFFPRSMAIIKIITIAHDPQASFSD
jgi:hypothetical protein